MSALGRELSAVAATDIQPPPYELGPESHRHNGVPRGKLMNGVWEDTTVYRGQIRSYRVYVPPGASRDTCLMVVQDGHLYADLKGEIRAPVVLDNLIHAREIPPVAAIFVSPTFGESAAAAKRANVPVRFSRGDQYDPLDGTYSRFLLDELLPGLAERYGLSWSSDPNRRAVCGFSCGAAASFTVAWQRPDAFRKVLTHCGAFSALRGADQYPVFVRRTEPKPLRVFLLSGSHDNDNKTGHISLSNQQMAAALRFRKYDYRFVYGAGGHDGQHMGAIFPDAMRWLWRGVS